MSSRYELRSKNKAKTTTTTAAARTGQTGNATPAPARVMTKISTSKTHSAASRKRKLSGSYSKTVDEDPKESMSKAKKSRSAKFCETQPQTSTSANGNGNVGPGQALSAVPAPGATQTMLNELVLSAIAEKLPTRHLFSLRETCTIWNRNFVTKVAGEEHSYLCVHSDVDRHRRAVAENSKRELGRRPNLLITEFASMLRASKYFPAGGFYIYNVGLGPERNLNHFFGICGTKITRLILDLHLSNLKSGSTLDIVRQIVFNWTPELRYLMLCPDGDFWEGRRSSGEGAGLFKKNIPKLRSFTFLINRMSNLDYRNYSQLLEDVVQSATELENLSLYGDNLPVAFQALCGIREDEQSMGSITPTRLARLKSLVVIRELKAQNLRLLNRVASFGGGQYRLGLHDLKLSIPCRNPEEQEASDAEMVDLTYRFLLSQASTLCSLDINIHGMNYETGSRFALRLPRMERLQTLTLTRNATWQLSVQPDSGTSFTENFPRLRSLSFVNELIERAEPGIIAVPISQFVHEGVRVLKFELQETDGNENQMALLSLLPSTWPFVTKLDLRVEHYATKIKLLRSFWTLWPGLISLHMRLSYCFPDEIRLLDLDELLSGIPASKFFAVRRQLRAAPAPVLTMESLRALQAKYKTKPGISDLGQLQEFVLDNINPRTPSITDIGGYLGLAMLPGPAVQHVAVINRITEETPDKDREGKRDRYKGNRISDECRSFIKSAFAQYAIVDV